MLEQGKIETLNMWQCMELGPAWAMSKHVVDKIEKTLKNIHYNTFER